jgi:hypothetical protein
MSVKSEALESQATRTTAGANALRLNAARGIVHRQNQMHRLLRCLSFNEAKSNGNYPV